MKTRFLHRREASRGDMQAAPARCDGTPKVWKEDSSAGMCEGNDEVPLGGFARSSTVVSKTTTWASKKCLVSLAWLEIRTPKKATARSVPR